MLLLFLHVLYILCEHLLDLILVIKLLSGMDAQRPLKFADVWLFVDLVSVANDLHIVYKVFLDLIVMRLPHLKLRIIVLVRATTVLTNRYSKILFHIYFDIQ